MDADRTGILLQYLSSTSRTGVSQDERLRQITEYFEGVRNQDRIIGISERLAAAENKIDSYELQHAQLASSVLSITEIEKHLSEKSLNKWTVISGIVSVFSLMVAVIAVLK